MAPHRVRRAGLRVADEAQALLLRAGRGGAGVSGAFPGQRAAAQGKSLPAPAHARVARKQNCDVNVAALPEFLREKFPVFDVCRGLKDPQHRAARNHKLCIRSSKVGDYNVRVHSLVITPTRVYCQPPQVERSNRVLLRYRGVANRFLRVTFTDEGMHCISTQQRR
jgi:hypothetical protein